MAARWCLVLLVLVLAAAAAGAEKGKWDPVIRMPGEKEPAGSHSHSGEGFEGEEGDAVGTRWAVLVAGSSGYGNYRHQVKERTSDSNSYGAGSHVMEYGDKTFKGEKLYLYQGFDPANANVTNKLLWPGQEAVVNQRDADILFLWKRYELLHGKSEEKQEVLREITGTVRHRKHLDSSIGFIGKLLFGIEKGPSTLQAVRPPGQPLVDDWDCLKQMVRIFESHCGSLTQYGMKHMRAFANICNSGTPGASMKQASISACGSYNSARWSPLVQGYSA